MGCRVEGVGSRVWSLGFAASIGFCFLGLRPQGNLMNSWFRTKSLKCFTVGSARTTNAIRGMLVVADTMTKQGT